MSAPDRGFRTGLGVDRPPASAAPDEGAELSTGLRNGQHRRAFFLPPAGRQRDLAEPQAAAVGEAAETIEQRRGVVVGRRQAQFEAFRLGDDGQGTNKGAGEGIETRGRDGGRRRWTQVRHVFQAPQGGGYLHLVPCTSFSWRVHAAASAPISRA